MKKTIELVSFKVNRNSYGGYIATVYDSVEHCYTSCIYSGYSINETFRIMRKNGVICPNRFKKIGG